MTVVASLLLFDTEERFKPSTAVENFNFYSCPIAGLRPLRMRLAVTGGTIGPRGLARLSVYCLIILRGEFLLFSIILN